MDKQDRELLILGFQTVKDLVFRGLRFLNRIERDNKITIYSRAERDELYNKAMETMSFNTHQSEADVSTRGAAKGSRKT